MGQAKVSNCFYEARKISTVSIVEFSNPVQLSRPGLIYTDWFFCARREPARYPPARWLRLMFAASWRTAVKPKIHRAHPKVSYCRFEETYIEIPGDRDGYELSAGKRRPQCHPLYHDLHISCRDRWLWNRYPILLQPFQMQLYSFFHQFCRLLLGFARGNHSREIWQYAE